MDVLYPCCCGLDVHKKLVVACLLTPGPKGQPTREVRSFTTMSGDLLRLVDWLQAAGCTHLAMESTGGYWKPIYNLCEDLFTVLVVTPQHIMAVLGRKTDGRDAEWIADLLHYGLLHPSFIPPAPQRELRELTRYRSTLAQERAAEVNRIQQTLEGANIKLAAVATDVLGVSGRAMLEALVAGTTDAVTLARLARGRLACGRLARGRLRDKRADLEQALSGRVGAHHRFLLAEQLCHVDALDESIARLSQAIAERLRPFEAELQRVQTIPGGGRRGAEVLLAEIGPDMTRFPTAHPLAAWAGMCPGNYESAGKRQKGTPTKGSPWRRAMLAEAAWGASHTTATYLAAQYHRLAVKRGRKRAIVAVGHRILVIAYHVLARQQPYAELGPTSFEERDRQATERRLVRRLEHLGLKVTIEHPSPLA